MQFWLASAIFCSLGFHTTTFECSTLCKSLLKSHHSKKPVGVVLLDIVAQNMVANRQIDRLDEPSTVSLS